MEEMYFIPIKIMRIKVYTTHVQKRNVVIAFFKNSSLFFPGKKKSPERYQNIRSVSLSMVGW